MSGGLDTIRWGDTQQLVYQAGSQDVAQNIATKQLISARWRWPLTWTVLVIIVPSFGSLESATFTLTIIVQVGCGSAMVQYPIPYTIAPVGGVYVAQSAQLFIPAHDLQMGAVLTGTPVNSAAGAVSCTLLTAPMTEPHAPTQTMETLRGSQPGVHPWMPEGFYEDRLRYRNEDDPDMGRPGLPYPGPPFAGR
jgi:hypothetical protein